MHASLLNRALYLIGENYMELVVPSQEFKSAFECFYEDFAQNDVENAEYYLEGKLIFPNMFSA